MNHPTSTAQWSLAIHRVTGTSVEVWVGTLFPTLKLPERARIRLLDGDRHLRARVIRREDWRRPFSRMKRRFFCVATFRRLAPGHDYRLEFERRVETNQKIGLARHWQRLRSGRFRTLPSRLPRAGEGAFTLGLGSCFYNHRDGGQAAAAYKALHDRGDPAVRPDLTVLAGDQVYLDIGFDSLSLVPGEIRERIADDYALHWQALGSILSRGGTWMLPDDHEYWNDYPFVDSPVPTLLALKVPGVRRIWRRAARDGVRHIQRSPVVESFSLGNELTVCLADLRSHRSERGFLPDADFEKLLRWARRRTSPGVLAIAQPLIVTESRAERNLRSFPRQYARLLDALGAPGHDVVVLSGDVHFGRIASVALGNAGARLIEIISSPLSNLTGLNGIATNVAKADPAHFPPAADAEALGWASRPVDYFTEGGRRGRFFVGTRNGWPLSAYPKRRTREHFMTVSFRRLPEGDVELTAEAWLARRRRGPAHMPVRAFAEPFRVTLR
ncbi:MAG: hypothetical protein F4W89_16760 [Acidobacteria bacterium]|nr:hypothetical protein [Acidobacteriota bacterium]